MFRHLMLCLGYGLLWMVSLSAQADLPDSLQLKYPSKLPVTKLILSYDSLARSYMYSKPFVALAYAKEAHALSQQHNLPKDIARQLNRLGAIYRLAGNYPQALSMHLQSLQVAQSNQDYDGMARTLNNMGNLYAEQKDEIKTLKSYQEGLRMAQQANDKGLMEIIMSNIGSYYATTNRLDSAIFYVQRAYQMGSKSENLHVLLLSLANLSYRTGRLDNALSYYRRGVTFVKISNNKRLLGQTYYEMAKVFDSLKMRDSTLWYAHQALTLSQESQQYKYISEASTLLSSLYETTDPRLSLRYNKLAVAAKDSIFNQDKFRQLQQVEFGEHLRVAEIKAGEADFANRQKLGIMLTALAVAFAVVVGLYRNNRLKQRANNLLKRQKEEIDFQRNKAEKALFDLKTTQNLLVQREKLASLGELTAGVAHEIQNPLNFVNNFAEVTVELLDEAPKPPMGASEDWIPQEAPIGGWGAFFDDLRQNLQKINHHGKRASNIVKGMLEHSQAGVGVKKLVDLNALTYEYLTLSYQTLRAKNNNFEAQYEFIADPTLPKIEVVPQDIGRVLLNIINNAFQSQAASPQTPEGGLNKTHKVTVKTFKIEASNEAPFGGWGLSVSDNGAGIPADILPKIFQPFFTTKPTGEGTGLGLYLAYDIITKGYGGELTVESKVGEGSTFTIRLPLSLQT